MTATILKWAGSKRWLANSKQFPQPKYFKRYVEPFLGGGSIFFHIRPKLSLLCDLNEELIEFYRAVRDNPLELLVLMEKHQKKHCKDYYYEIRGRLSLCPIERAARFLYLNRTCWNGLYRVNLKGVFNVPIGTKEAVLFGNERFVNVAELLKRAELRVSDFEAAIGETCKGDFLFVDPPYTVKHNLNGFLKYNERLFSWEDQVRLRDALFEAIARGFLS